MPVSVSWDNESKTVIRYDLEGRWTWDEALTAFDTAALMLAEVQHTVNFIVNPVDPVSQIYVPPNTLGNLITLYRRSTDNAGISVLLINNATVRTLTRLMSTLNPAVATRFLFADSLEEARLILNAQASVKENLSHEI